MSITLEVNNLVKDYGDFRAVDGLSFSLERGDVLGFLGPNGAGKTTTMRMLTTFLPPTSGTAQVGGFDILTDANKVRNVIGYMPENPPLYEEMTVRSYLHFVAQLRQIPRQEVKDRIDQAIVKTDLGEKHKARLGTLSKGFRQRVGLAQAILHNPQVLILDEPTAGLDPHQIRQIRELIASLAEDHTLLLSTHILPEVLSTCTRILILNRGQKVFDDRLDSTQSTELEELFIRLTYQGHEVHEGNSDKDQELEASV